MMKKKFDDDLAHLTLNVLILSKCAWKKRKIDIKLFIKIHSMPIIRKLMFIIRSGEYFL